MDGRPTWTDCDEAGDYVVPNVLSPRDLVFRPDNMDETVPHASHLAYMFTNTTEEKDPTENIAPLYVETSIAGTFFITVPKIDKRTVFHGQNMKI